MQKINRFKVLEFPKEPTDYEDYEDIVPYNKLDNGNWKSLILNRHPLVWMLRERFNSYYSGKLMWRELNTMKEQIEKKKKDLNNYENSIYDRCWDLRKTIREAHNLCNSGAQEHISKLETIILSTLYNEKVDEEAPLANFNQVDDDVSMINHIISFIEPKETCAQKLQKHLDKCMGFDGTGRYKCTKDFNGCEFNENGRCDHYYEIERAKDDLDRFESYEYDANNEIEDLEYNYKRALAVKEDRLEEFFSYDSDDW